MIIADFVEWELDIFREKCNFTQEERCFFEYRASGETIELIAEMMNISVGKANVLSRKVKDKMKRVLMKI